MAAIYQLRIDLKGAKPPIWRRILISSEDNLYDLHCAIQNAMGWLNGHLHAFDKGTDYYGMILEEDDFMDFAETKDETKFRIKEVFSMEGDTLDYTYDFGDNWDHKIKLEKIITEKVEGQLPRCIKGKNACPPEDVGGLWGITICLKLFRTRSIRSISTIWNGWEMTGIRLILILMISMKRWLRDA